MLFTKYPFNPVLSPNPTNPWESLSVCNPGVAEGPDGIIYMLYRAGDSDSAYARCLGLATSRNGYDFVRASDQPVMRPDLNGWDAGALEDPRIVRINDWFYITYVAFPRAQFQCWNPKAFPLPVPEYPDEFPGSLKWNICGVGLAMTKDFKHFKRVGPITNRAIPDRNCTLFPERINGRFWRLHRPSLSGPEYGCKAPSVWIQHTEDLLNWRPENDKLLMTAEEEWEGSKIGANTPPLKTRLGWLVLYHGVSPVDKHYRIGAVLLDPDQPERVCYRTRDWLMEPTESWEIDGLYQAGGVVFPCGALIRDGKLIVYYGGGDQHIGVADCFLEDLLQNLHDQPA